jgi:site-specific DNA-cytosine methylase
MRVRRLTPVECERLQGFPDNWSRIPWKGRPEEDCPDGPRYTACGNSMAVPVMHWIGSRIDMYEKTKPDRRDEETQNW